MKKESILFGNNFSWGGGEASSFHLIRKRFLIFGLIVGLLLLINLGFALPSVSIINPIDGSNVSSFPYINVISSNSNSTVINLDNSLVSWWRMDDNNGSVNSITDYLGTNNGTLTGNIVLNDTGYFGKSVTYDGTSGYIMFPTAQQTIPDGSNFTISTWIYPVSNLEASTDIFGMSHGGGAPKRAYSVDINVLTPHAIVGNSTDIIIANCPAVSLNQWANIIAIYNGTSITCYKNTVAGIPTVNTLSGTVPKKDILSYAGEIIGAGYHGAVRFFNGSIDDVIVFNRSLNQEEINALYSATSINYQKSFIDGSHSLIAYSQDSSADITNATSIFNTNQSIDDVGPAITINYPVNNSKYNLNLYNFNMTAIDLNSTTDSCWFTLNGGIANYTMTNTTAVEDYNYTHSSIDDGSYTANFYCNDTASNINTEEIYFIKDTTFPLISFIWDSLINFNHYALKSIFVNVSSSDANEYFVVNNFDNSLVTWIRFDNLSTDFYGKSYFRDMMNNNNAFNATYNISSGKFGIGAQIPGADVINLYYGKSLSGFSGDFYQEEDYTYSPIQTSLHLQGVAVDDDENIYWSYTNNLVKTYFNGTIITNTSVSKHLGDICYADGKIYGGWTDGYLYGDTESSHNNLTVYNATDLSLIGSHYLDEIEYANGGVACYNNSFYMLGGYPYDAEDIPLEVYEFNSSFGFVKKHTLMDEKPRGTYGIEAMERYHGNWVLATYNSTYRYVVYDDNFNFLHTKTGISTTEGFTELKDGSLLVASSYINPTLYDGRYKKARLNTLNITSNMTFALWAKTDWSISDLTTGSRLLRTTTDEGLFFSETSDTLVLKISTDEGHAIRPTISNSDWTKNIWHQIVAVYDKDKIYLYLDGELSDWKDRDGTNLTQINGQWVISDPTYPFNGSVDDIMVFNKALTNNEILALYNASTNKYSSNFTELTEGTHILTAYAQDIMGNINSSSATFFIDSISPQITINSPTAMTYTTSSVLLNVTLDENGTCLYSANVGVVNVSMDTTDNLTFTKTLSSLADGSYTANFYCNDTSGNRNDTMNVSFSVAVPVEETPASSSGGGLPTYYPTQLNLEQGYTKSLGKNWEISFKLNNENHKLKVININNTNKTATITISSTPQTKTLFIGDEWKINLNNDNTYDIYVKLNNVTQTMANIYIKSINETIEKGIIKQENGVEEKTDEIIKDKENNYLKYFAIFVLVIILLGLGLLFIRIKHRKKHHNKYLVFK